MPPPFRRHPYCKSRLVFTTLNWMSRSFINLLRTRSRGSLACAESNKHWDRDVRLRLRTVYLSVQRPSQPCYLLTCTLSSSCDENSSFVHCSPLAYNGTELNKSQLLASHGRPLHLLSGFPCRSNHTSRVTGN